jgi:hypothetical protein
MTDFDPYRGRARELAPIRLRAAVESAVAHVWRQQHVGNHEQDRWDAMAWAEKYTAGGRCKCPKCVAAWERGDPSAAAGT